MKGFALIVPIGPGPVELRRFHDLLDSLWAYEPHARLCVAIDSSPIPRTVAPHHYGPCRFVTLRAPFLGEGDPLLGRLSASMLSGFDVIRRHGPFDFVLRADTDALVTGCFRHRIARFLREHPQTGMVGTLGHTCRRDSPHYGCEKISVSDVVTALRSLPPDSPGFARISAWHALAVRNLYVGKEYCQGGIYVLAFETLRRLHSLGCLDHPEDWLPAAVPEDVMVGMLTRTAGLACADFSAPGEPFASNYRGLAYSPAETLQRQHALIHSVKSDPRYQERALRRHFQNRRAHLRTYPSSAFFVTSSR